MCIKYIAEPSKKSGYGFKSVYPSKVPGEFRGEWTYFEKSGHGGCGSAFDSCGRKRDVVRNGIRWKVGRLYRVKHNREAKAETRNRKGEKYYRAGVHLYSSPYFSVPGAGAVLVCRYTNAVAVCKFTHVVVALRVTPLLALSQRDFATFRSFIKMANGDIEQAVKNWQGI